MFEPDHSTTRLGDEPFRVLMAITLPEREAVVNANEVGLSPGISAGRIGRRFFQNRGTLVHCGTAESMLEREVWRLKSVIARTYAREVNLWTGIWVNSGFAKSRYTGGTVAHSAGRPGRFTSHKKAREFTKRRRGRERLRTKGVVNRVTWNSRPEMNGALIRSRSE